MWPSTRATWLEAATSVDWVTFRELATTLKPRSTNPFTIPAPIPCDAPVTIAVLRRSLIVLTSPGSGSSRSEIRVQHDAIARLAGFESREGFVDLAHGIMLGLRGDVVSR